MNGIIINPNSLNSVIASSRIALFLGKKFGIPVVGRSNYEEVKAKKFDWAFLMNSGFGSTRDEKFGMWIAGVVKNSNHQIFVANDYKLLPPCGYTRFITPKRYTYWSTVPEWNGSLCKKLIYVNWNKLSYAPIPAQKDYIFDKCVYWGAYRKHRIDYFAKYLNNSFTTISTSSRARKGFEETCPKAKIVENYQGLLKQIQKYACTLYLEDYTRKYCSPANRFYEAISAGVPMFFMSESYVHMKEAGYDVKKYIVDSMEDIKKKFPTDLSEVRKEQSVWRRNYISELDKEIDKAYNESK